MSGLGVSPASLLALPAFLATVFGASDFLTTIFSETLEDISDREKNVSMIVHSLH